MKREIPAWIDYIIIPFTNIFLAFLLSGVLIAFIGENPFTAIYIMVKGSFGYQDAIFYTLYYTTNFIFAGLAACVAFNASLFNIGAEGQAYIGGLGVGLVMLAFDNTLPFYLLIPLGILGAIIFGALWAFIPAVLQAYKGSHIVITTIMFNFIASALMLYLLVNFLIEPNQQAPQTRTFAEAGHLLSMRSILSWLGLKTSYAPLNISFLFALISAFLVWVYIWRTSKGYELRVVGQNEKVSTYAGISFKKTTVITLLISGGLAGMMAVNEIMGVHHKLLQDFPAGFGFAGIAVSLMGRNHPLGVVLASLLFGFLYQGGAELAFEKPAINKEIILVIQGLIVLFSGALGYMLKPYIEKIYSFLFFSRKTH